jgi:hypothetical protein
MRISDLIRKLEILKEKHGDNILSFSVKDSFKIHGREATMDLRVGDTDGMPSDWAGCWTNDGRTRLEVRLSDDYDGKKANITYRKSCI